MPSVSQANSQGRWAQAPGLTSNILTKASQQGLIPGTPVLEKHFTALVLHRGLHPNAHLCWHRGYGHRPGNRGLMPGRALLSTGTDTQYSSAQTESGH